MHCLFFAPPALYLRPRAPRPQACESESTNRCSARVQVIPATRGQTTGRARAHLYMCSSSLNADGSQSCALRIAAAFVEACMPSSKSYAEQLRAFCEEALDAYCRGYSLVALQLEMSGSPSRVYGRALASDEVELRSVWLSLVFKTLRYTCFPTTTSQDSNNFPQSLERDRLDEFVLNIVEATRKGYDMKRIQLEQALTASETSGKPRTPVENAILNQSVRLVLTTLQVADDHRQNETL